MPGGDGLTCAYCRNRASERAARLTPRLCFTARGEDMDRIIGLLRMGADDYLAKPLRAARALRPHPRGAATTPRVAANLDAARPPTRLLRAALAPGPNQPSRHLAWSTPGRAVVLSAPRYRISRSSCPRPQRCCRDQLMELPRGRRADVFDRSIDLLVNPRLRQRLGDNARRPAIIRPIAQRATCSPPRSSPRTRGHRQTAARWISPAAAQPVRPLMLMAGRHDTRCWRVSLACSSSASAGASGAVRCSRAWRGRSPASPKLLDHMSPPSASAGSTRSPAAAASRCAHSHLRPLA